LDAGDVFQGTPYFNFYSAEPDFRAMTMMGYDAMAIGNHEFDNRVEGFMKVHHHGQFPFVCANYDFGTSPMADVVKPYIIKDIDGLKIGIFGIGVDLAGLVLATHPVCRLLWQLPQIPQELRLCDRTNPSWLQKRCGDGSEIERHRSDHRWPFAYLHPHTRKLDKFNRPPCDGDPSGT